MKTMKRFVVVLMVLGTLLSGCATVQLGSIPRPAETTKLRVAVVPISGYAARRGWGVSTEDFVSNQYRATRMILDRFGYYEVVPEAESKTVLAGYDPTIWEMTRNQAELARRVGRALYADYVLLVERGTAVGGDPHYYFELILVNVETGKEIGVRIENDRRRTHYKLPPGTGKVAYRQLFRDARGDLLTTALRKSGRGGTPPKDEQIKKREGVDQLRIVAEQAAEQRRKAEAEALKRAEEARLAAERLAAERRDIEERLAKERAGAERAAQEAARLKAEADRKAAELGALKKTEEERRLRALAEAERRAAEQAAQERAEAERKLALAKAEAEAEAERQAAEEKRLRAAQQAEQERQERERLARIKAEEHKLAASGLVATGSRVVDYMAAEQEENRQIRGAKRLIVYDFATTAEYYQPVALLLSEALREEIHSRGAYNLVNRENLQQLMNEMKFQQSGLVDTAQVVQLGKGAGAQEIVTGNLGALGQTVLLQSKRTDIQSMLNLAFASLKSESGKEDLLLARLAEMVDKLLAQRK